MDLGRGLGHLTYSTLVHPGDTWPEIWDSLNRYVPQVKQRVAPNEPFGVSLRISAASAEALTRDAGERAKLKAFLDDNDMYLYTVNAFPYGPFKNTLVKKQVYEPDWRSDERAVYTMQVADILAEVAAPGIEPTIQSPPLGFKPRVTGPEVVAAYTRQVLRTVAHLIELERKTGRKVRLALEPEPFCFLETTEEAVDYFTNHLYADSAADSVAKQTGLSRGEAHAALRDHLGMVYDICHQAVEYEDVGVSLRTLADVGIPVFKLQEAAAVRVPVVTQETVDAMREFADTVYLTQTVERRDGHLTRFLNLEDAFAAWESDPGPREWRTHFHVPVFLDDLGPFKTTRFAIEDALKFHRENKLSPQLEIETYTWDVLPEHLKTGDIVDYVTREIEWVRDQLLGA
ncbi:MAG TPA: metabolite traffic protein EboE [Gammaproteobacteria bacterium]|nr:metabolite traffic protein EboE [Gammaproteobacteria bacterium]